MIVAEARQFTDMAYNKAMEQKDSNEQLEEVLSSLNLPPISRKIYMRLLGNRSLSARMLAEALDIPRPSVYDHIRLLQDKDLVIPKKQEGKLFFSANDPHHIQSLIDIQESKYKEMKKVFGNLLPRLQADADSAEPKIQFFKGIEGIKNMQNDILWLKDTETYSMWSTQTMNGLLGSEYLAWHSKRRVEQNISVNTIQQGFEINSEIGGVTQTFSQESAQTLRTVKYASQIIDTDTSYWIYGDKVAFFDSSDELYGFIVHSKSFSNLMKVHFNILWGMLK